MTYMTGLYTRERLAIEALRSKYPTEGVWTFAKRIRNRNYFVGDEAALAQTAGARTFLSILSVIRRYDARQKAAKRVPVAALAAVA